MASADFALHNFIDQRLDRVLSPLQLARAPAALRQYRADRGRVTPLRAFDCVLSGLTMSFLISLYVFSTWQNDQPRFQNVAALLARTGGLFIIYTHNLVSSLSSVSLVVSMQSLFQGLDEAAASEFARLRLYSWLLCVAVYTLPLAIYSSLFDLAIQGFPYNLIRPLTGVIYNFALADSAVLIKALAFFVSALLDKLDNIANDTRLCNEKESKSLVDTMDTILAAYDLLKNTTRVQILVYSAKIFFEVLLYLRLFLEQQVVTTNQNPISLSLLALMYGTFVFNLCVQYERFYSRVAALKMAASRVLKRRLDDEYACRASKSILHLLRASYSKFSVVGVPVDAAYPAALAWLLGQYVLLHLQVALL